MIPCYSLFLEVEIPDPALNYFVLGRDEIEGDRELAPNIIAPPDSDVDLPYQFELSVVSGGPWEEYPPPFLWTYEWLLKLASAGDMPAYFEMFKDGEPLFSSEGPLNPYDDFTIYVSATEGNEDPIDVETICYDKDPEDPKAKEVWRDTLTLTPPTRTRIGIEVEEVLYEGTDWKVILENYSYIERYYKVVYEPGFISNAFLTGWSFTSDNDPSQSFTQGRDPIAQEQIFRITYRKGSSGLEDAPTFQFDFIDMGSGTEEPFSETFTDNFEWEEDFCVVSGYNTLVLNTSCIESQVDLLEGYGAAGPGMAWVDLITDTTDIKIERGFDSAQGVVGTPIAGVLSANITDPYLDALATQRVAIGQRCRLRAGGTIVFTGVVNTLRSDYNAVDTPTLYLESVDALGLLNAQMVDVRPQENYQTRLQAAVDKVGLNAIIENTTTELNPTEDPMSALDLLVETQDSEGSVCWLDRFGTFYSTNRYWKTNTNTEVLRDSRFYSNAKFLFSNNPKGTSNINISGSMEELCLSEYRQSADTKEVINGITFYNFVEEEQEGTDDNGDPYIEKTIVRDTFTFESGNSRRLYGDAGVKLTTYLNPSTLPAYADYIFQNYDTPYTKVEKIAFPLDKWKSLAVPQATQLDIGDKVLVEIDDPYSGQQLAFNNQRIAKIIHTITPVEWLCELELI